MPIKNAFRLTAFFVCSLLLVSGCSNPEQEACLQNASRLWDNSTNDPDANQAYWKAVEACKEKYP